MAERVRSAGDCVKFHQSYKDPSGAVLRFVLNVVAALVRSSVSSVVRDRDTCKSLIEKLVNKLEPPEFRERIKDSRECWLAEQKSDLSFSQATVSALAVDIAQGEMARARLKRRFPRNRHSNSDQI